MPLWFALVGLALYTVLGGADFGAGFWQLVAGSGKQADEVRDEAHHAMAPVWEANHVWLIFILTVVWTAYPAAFGSIASTLSIPLFIAGVGIVMRGGAYALRAGTRSAGEQRRVDTVFALSSVLTPFALGTVIGAIASERVHLGNPGGSLVTSWLNPTSIAIGMLAVASGAYTSAVFLSGDAERQGDRALADRFRARALGAGLTAGAIAIGALIVLDFDAERIFRRLTQGVGLPALVASVIAGIATLALLWRRRYEPARYLAAVAVAATIAGWALAQNPVFLHGLTIHEAAAGHDTLVAVVVAVLVGALLLFPSLALLFRLTLGGKLRDSGPSSVEAPVGSRRRGLVSVRLDTRLSVAFLVAGIGFLTVANAGWAHAIGVACFFGFILSGFRAALPPDIVD
ncbi:MAG TPA: cytochrome d ubiquinol oxidase subunit II, partial [Verrucomicrobiae bacterium]|nr:cytochrome d ubiquinol oxidase subunit II [Verrucomicrobiae bacterium]